MTAFTLCDECGTPIENASAHLRHDPDCDRFVTGWCRCDGWLCLVCCPDQECTPLIEALRAAREADRVAAEAT